MLQFLRGDADCLVATTIIESADGEHAESSNAPTSSAWPRPTRSVAVCRSRERAFAYLLYPLPSAH